MDRRYIELDAEGRKAVRQAMRTSDTGVSNALAFRSNTDKAQRIRQYAMNHGGVLMVVSRANEQRL